MKTLPFLLHALSPVHAGTGQTVDVIDLPIARMRATGMPYLPGSSIKGVLRDAMRVDGRDTDNGTAIFGPDTENASDHSGALMVGDARLLAMPVRSFKGTFAWVTSPLLLMLAHRDFAEAQIATPSVPSLAGRSAMVPNSQSAVVFTANNQAKVYLEDLDIPATENADVAAWAAFLAPLVAPNKPEIFSSRFLVVDDETMTFLWETCTQIDTRVRLNSQTRVVEEGALWVEESLPPESLLVGLLVAELSRKKGQSMTPADVLAAVLSRERILQFGGKATIGRGRCRVIPVT